MDTLTLKHILLEALSGYAVRGLNGYSNLTYNDDQTIFTIVSIAHIKTERYVTTSLIVRLEANHIFIEHDINSKPLVDALIQQGVSRDQITLAYAGETLPEKIV